jgi:hypothetical protein
MAAAKKPTPKVAANSKAGAKSTAQKARDAREKASGTQSFKVAGVRQFGGTPTKYEKQNAAKVSATYALKKNNEKGVKVEETKGKTKLMSGFAKVYKVTTPKVDADAYSILAKKAKAAGLKGMDAEAAVEKAMKAVSTRMKNDRQRTASRGEAIVRRERKKRQNTDLS